MYLRLIRASTDANRPALRTGQWFVATRLKKPALFTLVRYKSKAQYLINRVCGLPGDVVQLKAGDNRPHATDSRHHGFIKESQVLGSVLWK